MGRLLRVLCNGKPEVVKKLIPKDTQYSGQFLCFPLERFPTAVSNCSFLVLESFNELVSTQQQLQGNKCFQLLIFPILSHYSSLRIHCSFQLSCLEATALLPEEILSMLMSAPADFDWTAPTLGFKSHCCIQCYARDGNLFTRGSLTEK